jgi:hypothetical protein
VFSDVNKIPVLFNKFCVKDVGRNTDCSFFIYCVHKRKIRVNARCVNLSYKWLAGVMRLTHIGIILSSEFEAIAPDTHVGSTPFWPARAIGSDAGNLVAPPPASESSAGFVL